MKCKAVVLPQYNRNILRAMLSLSVGETELPPLQPDEVLVKVAAAPCNPSDIAFMQGGYNIVKPLPAVPGFEGAGTVEDTGSEKTKHLKGKKVSFFIRDHRPGSWAEFVTVKTDSIIVMDDDADMFQAACFSVNPLTAYALMQVAERTKTKALVQNASGGQVAAFLRQMAYEKGLEVIDVVRKPETASELTKEGCHHVLVESDPGFEQKLSGLVRELQAHVAFDAVGGLTGSQIFNALPPDSQLVVYGGLSNKPLTGINTMDVIFHNKIITGFNLPEWKQSLTQMEFDEHVSVLQKKFKEKKLATKIQGETSLENIVKGLRNYIANMSAGKILIVP